MVKLLHRRGGWGGGGGGVGGYVICLWLLTLLIKSEMFLFTICI